MSNSVRKSLYVFLCSLMGAMLFLILHRIVIFIYLALLDYNYGAFSLGISYFKFLVWDYFTLILILLLGGWYGVWVGLHWFESIYEHSTHEGFVHHLIGRYWPNKPGSYNLKSRISEVAKKVETDMWELEDLAKRATALPASPVAVKRKVVRKKPASKS